VAGYLLVLLGRLAVDRLRRPAQPATPPQPEAVTA